MKASSGFLSDMGFVGFFLMLNIFVAVLLFQSRMDARYPQCLHCKVIPLKNS